MARRLVLNGLTAEVLGSTEIRRPRHVDTGEFYHELELYRQLLALPVENLKDPSDEDHENDVTVSSEDLAIASEDLTVEDTSNNVEDSSKGVTSSSKHLTDSPKHLTVTSTNPAFTSKDDTLSLKDFVISSEDTAVSSKDLANNATVLLNDVSNDINLMDFVVSSDVAKVQVTNSGDEPNAVLAQTSEVTEASADSVISYVGGNKSEFTTEYPAEHVRPAMYLGSFPARGPGRTSLDTDRILLTKESGQAVPVLVIVALSGVKVCDPEDQKVRMWHALRRISYASCEAARALFAFVAREPSTTAPAPKPAAPSIRHFCHAFQTETPHQAAELNALVGDAFRMAFASQLQPSAPLWCSELSGGERGMGVRAPDSLPGLQRHYPHCLTGCDDASPASEPSPSPSSSEEWCAGPARSAGGSYRRLGERAPLMRRLAAALLPSDDDSTPLVPDTPTTPATTPLCLSEGYINEASEAEARTRESNRDTTPKRYAQHTRDERSERAKFASVSNSGPRTCSASSSSGSSCGASACSGNNNQRFTTEPELRQAPWFQHGIPREIALEVLAGQGVGAFLVRGSTTQPACYALSVRVPADFAAHGIAHYLIQRTAKGYKIKGFTKEFTSLSALVTHHSVMPELLPVPLRLPRPTMPPCVPRRDHADIDAVAPCMPRRGNVVDNMATSHRNTPHHVASFLTLDV